MKIKQNTIINIMVLALLTLPLMARAQDEDPFALEGVEAEADEQPVVEDEVSIGLYYLDDDSYRYGKFTGLVEEEVEPLLDFRIERRPQWDSEDSRRWSIQGWRLGLDSPDEQPRHRLRGTHLP